MYFGIILDMYVLVYVYVYYWTSIRYAYFGIILDTVAVVAYFGTHASAMGRYGYHREYNTMVISLVNMDS